MLKARKNYFWLTGIVRGRFCNARNTNLSLRSTGSKIEFKLSLNVENSAANLKIDFLFASLSLVSCEPFGHAATSICWKVKQTIPDTFDEIWRTMWALNSIWGNQMSPERRCSNADNPTMAFSLSFSSFFFGLRNKLYVSLQPTTTCYTKREK